MKLKGTIILTLVSLLERFSYYGVRAILILYTIESSFLNFERNHTSEIYAYWTSALLIASIPFSLLTDKYLGQKRSIYYGGTLTLIGYLLLIIPNQYVLLLSIILILAGTSLVKPSTTILIGRQFKKENKKRTLSYMIFFMGINIGAFMGILGIGYLAEISTYKYGFIVAAMATSAYLLIVYLFRLNIEEVESNILSNQPLKLTLNRTILILPILLLVQVVFWKNYEIETSELLFTFSKLENRIFFGYEVPRSMLSSFLSVWTIPLSVLVFIYWYINGVSNIFKSIAISLLLLLLAVIGTLVFNYIQPNNPLEWSLVPLGIYAFGEVIISPILISYVTRISDINYSNTIYSIFILSTYLLGAGFVYLLQNEYQLYITLSTLSLTIIGIILFKDKISKLTYDIK